MRRKVRGPGAGWSEPDDGVGLAGSSGAAAVGDDANMLSKTELVVDSPPSRARRRGAPGAAAGVEVELDATAAAPLLMPAAAADMAACTGASAAALAAATASTMGEAPVGTSGVDDMPAAALGRAAAAEAAPRPLGGVLLRARGALPNGLVPADAATSVACCAPNGDC